ncbi:MAG: hypothetical protein V4476_22240 [Pseudomonadota bacterium]
MRPSKNYYQNHNIPRYSSRFTFPFMGALELDAREFLGGINKHVLHTSLRHIPEVSQFLNGAVPLRLHAGQ